MIVDPSSEEKRKALENALPLDNSEDFNIILNLVK